MKKLKFLGIILSVFALFSVFPHTTLAATPTLSLNNLGNNTVQLTVNGDSNSSVNLYYLSGNAVVSVGNIGMTSSNGYFATTIYNGTYNIPSGANTYVVVNSQQSNTVSWPSNNNGGGGTITFSQNNVTLNYGQSMVVTIYGGVGSYYISSNSNSNFVNAYISGNQIYLSSPSNQNVGGSATITVCSNSGNSSCGYLYVNQNGGGYQSLSFSQNNLNLSVGQGMTISIFGNNGNFGSYYVSNNSNSNVVAAYVSGNVLNVSGLQYGTSNITVCSNSGNSSCGTLYANVSTNGYYNNNNNYYNNGSYNNPPVVYVQPGAPVSYMTGYGSGYGTPSAGVYLNQVPSTGISASLKTDLFFAGIFMTSAFGAYMVLSHRKYKKVLANLN